MLEVKVTALVGNKELTAERRRAFAPRFGRRLDTFIKASTTSGAIQLVILFRETPDD